MLANALTGGKVAAFQFRVKDMTIEEAFALAEPLIDICRNNEVAFIVNDDVSLAQRLSADGVHLGQSDQKLSAARAILGDDVQIGITCHDSRHLAMEAGEGGADYVAFGAFYPTITKDVAHRADTDILQWWSSIMEVPCVAIGGVTPDNALPLVESGADFLAVSQGVWGDEKGPAHAVSRFNEILNKK